MHDPVQDSQRIQNNAEQAIKDSQALMLPATEDVLAMADWSRKTPLLKRVRVQRRLYFFFFIFFTLLLSIGSFRIFHDEEGPLMRVERLYAPSPFTAFPEPLPTNQTRLAHEFEVTIDQLATTERILQELYDRNTQGFLGPLDWGLNVGFGDYTLVISYRIFVNMGIAVLVTLALYLLARSGQASEIIEAQNTDLRKLTDTLKVKVSEAESYLNELTKTQTSLLQTQKLASIGRLSATLAHEIRNPMSIIKSAAMMARDDIEKENPAQDALYLIQQETVRLDGIITDLLHFARPKKPTTVDVNLEESLQSWITAIEDELKRSGISISYEILDKLPNVLVDPDQLYQIFLNIVWNSRDAINNQKDRDKPAFLKVLVDTAGPTTVTMVIEDNGPGMNHDTLKQIYEPFFTTKIHGTGLGLPMVQQLMQGMGGSVLIDSIVGEGTVVTLVMSSLKPAQSRFYERLRTPSGEHEPNLDLDDRIISKN